MNEERTGKSDKWNIFVGICDTYFITVNQVMVATVKLSSNWKLKVSIISKFIIIDFAGDILHECNMNFT